MQEDSKIRILVWFDIFDNIVDSDDRDARAQTLFDGVDLVYAQNGSYQSACERAPSSKVHKLPLYVNNDDAVADYAKERELGGESSNQGKHLEIVNPIDVLAILVDKEVSEVENIFSKMTGDNKTPPGIPDNAINLANMSPEELEKELPTPIAEAFKGLNAAIEETSNRAQDIIQEYMSACDISGISEKQATDEGQSYVSSGGEIPAAEFICPVNILDKLNQI